MMTKVLHLKSSVAPSDLEMMLATGPNIEFVHVDHAHEGRPEENLIQLSRRRLSVKPHLVHLANRGFMAYALRNMVTSFVRHDQIKRLWFPVRDGVYEVDENDVVYQYSPPVIHTRSPKLLVVFSSMAADIYSASLKRHFEQNFATIQKHIPKDAAVLRIADLGGVVGAYYMNTLFRPNNEVNISSLIRRVLLRNGIERSDVVLYGTSKGGTAALFYGLGEHYKAVSVDPILADEVYLKIFNDSHFTDGVFPEDKREKFTRLISSLDATAVRNIAIVYSQRSPQFPHISSIVNEPLGRYVALFNSLHPGIKSHPDVAPSTINIVVMLINMMFYGLTPDVGTRSVI